MRTALLILAVALCSCSTASIPTDKGVIELTTFGSEVSYHQPDGAVLQIVSTGAAQHVTTEARKAFGLWRLLEVIDGWIQKD